MPVTTKYKIMTPNTNTPEQSAIPSEFKLWVELLCEEHYPSNAHDTQQNYFYRNVMRFMAEETYRHLRSQPTDEFKQAISLAAASYKEECKVDRDSGHLADCDFARGAEWCRLHLSEPIPSLRWVEEFKEWLSGQMEYTQGRAEHDGGAFWKGVYNVLSDVKDKVDEWPEESLLPVQSEAGLMAKAIRMRDAYNDYIIALSAELFVARGGKDTRVNHSKEQAHARVVLSEALKPFIGSDLQPPIELSK
jgi:hypothetical protein